MKLKFNKTTFLLALTVVALMTSQAAFAQDFGDVADNVSSQLGNFGKLALGAMFVAGLGVAGGAAFKFKAHSENAGQVPLKIPLFWALVAAILIAIPTFLATGKRSLFGDNSDSISVQDVQMDGY